MKIYIWDFGKGRGLGDKAKDILDVEATLTIYRLKARIQRLLSLGEEEMSHRILVIDNRKWSPVGPEILRDGKDLLADDDPTTTTLARCGVQDGDTLRLGYTGPFQLRLYENEHGRSYTITVSCSDKIHGIMGKIEEAIDNPVTAKNFPIVFLREQDRTLLSFGIYKVSRSGIAANPIFLTPDNTILSTRRVNYMPSTRPVPFPSFINHVIPNPERDEYTKSQIAIEFPNMPWKFPLTFNPTDTICAVRERICKGFYEHDELHGQMYIKKMQFVLFFGRKQLVDYSATLSQCRIEHGDLIQVFEDAEFNITVSPDIPSEPTFCVAMKCFHTIDMLVERIKECTDIPNRLQHLYYKRLPLDHKGMRWPPPPGMRWPPDHKEMRLVDYGMAKSVKYDKARVAIGPKNSPFWDRHSCEEFFVKLRLGSRAGCHLRKKKKTDVSSSVKRKQSEAGGHLHKKRKTEGVPLSKEYRLFDPIRHTNRKLIGVEMPKMPWRFFIAFKRTDTIRTVKDRIIYRCQQMDMPDHIHTYIEKRMFVVFFGTKLLDDESATVEQCGIGHLDCVQLFEDASFPIDISIPKCQFITQVEVKCFDTVGRLKEVVQGLQVLEKDILKDDLNLKYNDWCLDDEDRQLAYYGIVKKVEEDLSIIGGGGPLGDFFEERPKINVFDFS